MLVLGAFGVAGCCHHGMVGAADPAGIQQSPRKGGSGKAAPQVVSAGLETPGNDGVPFLGALRAGGFPTSGIKWLEGREGLEGARGREERSLEQTAGNCFSFVCCSREGSRAEKCILLI